MDLAPFINPAVPAPLQGPLVEDVEGWSEIDSWGAWECAVLCIVPMEDVPPAYRRALARVNLAVYGGTQEQIDRAIKWFLALSKLLLREPRREEQRGQGSGEIAARFEAVREGSWGTLLQLLRPDEEIERSRRERRNREWRQNVEPVMAKVLLLKTVLSLVSRGQVGRARRRVQVMD